MTRGQGEGGGSRLTRLYEDWIWQTGFDFEFTGFVSYCSKFRSCKLWKRFYPNLYSVYVIVLCVNYIANKKSLRFSYQAVVTWIWRWCITALPCNLFIQCFLEHASDVLFNRLLLDLSNLFNLMALWAYRYQRIQVFISVSWWYSSILRACWDMYHFIGRCCKNITLSSSRHNLID